MSDPIVFKCEDSLWRMLADGSRTFDMREWNLQDSRLRRLSLGRCPGYEDAPVFQPALRPDGWKPEEKTVSFLNKATGQVLTLEYRHMEFTLWAPGWCFLLLGKVVSNA